MPRRTEFSVPTVGFHPTRQHIIRKVEPIVVRSIGKSSGSKQVKTSVKLRSNMTGISQSKGLNQVKTTGGI